MRVDALLVARGLCPSRAAAKLAVQQGRVATKGGKVVKKVSRTISDDTQLILNTDISMQPGQSLRCVLDSFGVNFDGSDVVDIGASSGRLTEAAIEAGAASVLAVDCGAVTSSGARVRKCLRNDTRFTSVAVPLQSLGKQLPQNRYAVVLLDVSFVSLRLVLPEVWPFLDATSPTARVLALVKPQFEAGSQLGKTTDEAVRKTKGCLADHSLQLRLLAELLNFARSKLDGCVVLGSQVSPLAGIDGNREFVVSLGRRFDDAPAPGPFVSAAQLEDDSFHADAADRVEQEALPLSISGGFDIVWRAQQTESPDDLGGAALVAGLAHPSRPSARRKTAAARAAERRNANAASAPFPNGLSSVNANGLMGRKKENQDITSARRPKRYSKKNKPGTAHG